MQLALNHPSFERQSLARYSALYKTLPQVSDDQFSGRYHASFLGPWWLRKSAGPSIALAGMSGWFGKEFLSANAAINLVRRAGKTEQVIPMEIKLKRSFVDGQETKMTLYPKGSPFPWPHVVDEFRSLDENHLLGMTIIDAPLLRKLAFPFLLRKV